MNIYQKIILGIGAVFFIFLVGLNPVRHTMIGSRAYDYRPNFPGGYTKVDFYATSLRGLAVVGATFATWAIAGKTKKKTD